MRVSFWELLNSFLQFFTLIFTASFLLGHFFRNFIALFLDFLHLSCQFLSFGLEICLFMRYHIRSIVLNWCLIVYLFFSNFLIFLILFEGCSKEGKFYEWMIESHSRAKLEGGLYLAQKNSFSLSLKMDWFFQSFKCLFNLPFFVKVE